MTEGVAFSDAPSPQAPPRVTLRWLGAGWRLFCAQPGVWLAATLLYWALLIPLMLVNDLASTDSLLREYFPSAFAPLTGLLPATTRIRFLFDVLFGGLEEVLGGGLYGMALRQMRGEAITPSNLFPAARFVKPLFLVGAVQQLVYTILGAPPGIYGAVGTLAATFIVGVLLFAPLLVIDRGRNATDALSGSFDLLKSQWVRVGWFSFVTSLLTILGLLVCGVGLLATHAIADLTVAYGYREFMTPVSATANMPEDSEGVWPPPPTLPPPV